MAKPSVVATPELPSVKLNLTSPDAAVLWRCNNEFGTLVFIPIYLELLNSLFIILYLLIIDTLPLYNSVISSVVNSLSIIRKSSIYPFK